MRAKKWITGPGPTSPIILGILGLAAAALLAVRFLVAAGLLNIHGGAVNLLTSIGTAVAVVAVIGLHARRKILRERAEKSELIAALTVADGDRDNTRHRNWWKGYAAAVGDFHPECPRAVGRANPNNVVRLPNRR